MHLYFLFTPLLSLFLAQSVPAQQEKTPQEKLREMTSGVDMQLDCRNIAFELPEGWVRIDTTIERVHFTALIYAEDPYRTIISSGKELTLNKPVETYVADCKNRLLKEMPSVQLRAEGQMMVAGLPCPWFSYSQGEAGQRRILTFYAIIRNGIAINLTAGVNFEGYAARERVIEQIVLSMKFND